MKFRAFVAQIYSLSLAMGSLCVLFIELSRLRGEEIFESFVNRSDSLIFKILEN